MIARRLHPVARREALILALAAALFTLAATHAVAQTQRGGGGRNAGAQAAPAAAVTAQLERSRVAVGDSTLMLITVDGVDADTTPIAPTVPGLEIRFIDAPRSSQTFTSFINGRGSTRTVITVQYRYRVDVLKPGRHDIPPIPVSIGGRATNTQSLAIIAAEPEDNPDFFVELEISPQQAFVGEPVRLRATWYVTSAIAPGISFNMPGLSKLRLSEAPDPRPSGTRPDDPNYPLIEQYIGGPIYPIVVDNVEYKGRRFASITFDRVVTASAPGSYPIGPLRIAFDAGSGGGNVNRQYPGRGQRLVIASNPVTLEVLPLPAQGRPPGFDGLVGDYTLAARASSVSVRAGDPIDLTWTIAGSVTASTVPPMVLTSQRELADKFRVPIEPVVPRVSGRDAGFLAQVRPRPGATRIPPLTLNVFDTKLKQYRVLKSDPIALDMLPGGLISSDEPTPDASGPAESTALGPIPDHGAAVDPDGLMTSRAALGLGVLPPALASLLIGGVMIRRQRADDPVTQARIAARRAVRALRRIDPSRPDAADRAAGALDTFERRVAEVGGIERIVPSGEDVGQMNGVLASLDRFDRRRFAGRAIVIERRDLDQAADAVRAVVAPPPRPPGPDGARRLSVWLLPFAAAALVSLPIAARADDAPSPANPAGPSGTPNALDHLRSAESIAISDPLQARALASTALDELAALAAGPPGRSAPLHLAMARAYAVTGDIGRQQLALRRAARFSPWTTLLIAGEDAGGAAGGTGAGGANASAGSLASTQPIPMAWAGYVRAVDAPIRLWCLGAAWIILWGAIVARVLARDAEAWAMGASRVIACAGVAAVLLGASVGLDVLQTRAQRDELVVLKPVTARSGPDDVVFPAAGQPLAPGTLVHIVEGGPSEQGWLRVRTDAGDEADPVWLRAAAVERVVR